MSRDKHSAYVFADFTLDLDREALSRNGAEIRLRPKCFKVLCLLVENRGRLVTKSDLHQAAWKSSAVTDDSMAHCLVEIRRALGKHGHEIIRTVPRRGYIFDAPVSKLSNSPAPEFGEHLARPAPGWARHATITVVAFFGIAGFASLRLPSPADGTGPDQPATSLPVSGTAAGSSGLDRSSQAPRRDLAYQDYLKGRFFYDRRAPGDLDRAEAALRRAVHADPSLAPAWTGLAALYNLRLYENGEAHDDDLVAFGDAAHRAVALGPADADALIRLASFYGRVGESRRALQYVERAIELEPENPLVQGLLAGRLLLQGRFDDAIVMQRRAAAQQPLSIVDQNNLVSMLMIAGRTSEAMTEIEELAALNPADRERIDDLRAELYILNKRYAEALPIVSRRADALSRNRGLAMIHHGTGTDAGTRDAIDRLVTSDDPLAPYHLAAVYAERGEFDEAMRWLQSSGVPESPTSSGRDDLHRRSLLLLSPYLLPLRDDRRWRNLLTELNPNKGFDERLVAMVLEKPVGRAVSR